MNTPRPNRRRFKVARGSLGDAGAPFAQVRALGREHLQRRRLQAVVIVLATYIPLGWLAGQQRALPAPPAPPPRITPNVTLQPLPPPPPPAAPPPPPAQRPTTHSAAPHPAGAAAAAKVITQAPSAAPGPVDMTAFTMPEGNSAAFAGGATANAGTEKTAVQSADVAPQGHGSQAQTAAPGRKNWACDWPESEQQGSLRDVRVTLRVHVSRDGAAEEVELLDSPAVPFGDAARACALHETYHAALDDDGQRIPGITPAFVVHFIR